MIPKILFTLKNSPISAVALPLINAKFNKKFFSSKKQGVQKTFLVEDAEHIFEKFFK